MSVSLSFKFRRIFFSEVPTETSLGVPSCISPSFFFRVVFQDFHRRNPQEEFLELLEFLEEFSEKPLEEKSPGKVPKEILGRISKKPRGLSKKTTFRAAQELASIRKIMTDVLKELLETSDEISKIILGREYSRKEIYRKSKVFF